MLHYGFLTAFSHFPDKQLLQSTLWKAKEAEWSLSPTKCEGFVLIRAPQDPFGFGFVKSYYRSTECILISPLDFILHFLEV